MPIMILDQCFLFKSVYLQLFTQDRFFYSQQKLQMPINGSYIVIKYLNVRKLRFLRICYRSSYLRIGCVSHSFTKPFDCNDTQNNGHKKHQQNDQHGLDCTTMVLMELIVIPSQIRRIDRHVDVNILFFNLFGLAFTHVVIQNIDYSQAKTSIF